MYWRFQPLFCLLPLVALPTIQALPNQRDSTLSGLTDAVAVRSSPLLTSIPLQNDRHGGDANDEGNDGPTDNDCSDDSLHSAASCLPNVSGVMTSDGDGDRPPPSATGVQGVSASAIVSVTSDRDGDRPLSSTFEATGVQGVSASATGLVTGSDSDHDRSPTSTFDATGVQGTAATTPTTSTSQLFSPTQTQSFTPIATRTAGQPGAHDINGALTNLVPLPLVWIVVICGLGWDLLV